MSMLTDSIHDLLDKRHNRAVAKMAQVVADCESGNWFVAQQAHEDLQEMRMTTGDQAFDELLTEATEFMVRRDLRPNTWLEG